MAILMLFGALLVFWQSAATPPTWRSIGLGVLDGIVTTAVSPRAHNPIGIIRYAWLTWTGGDPASNDRQLVGEWLGSDTLSANPDDVTYHTTMSLTQVAIGTASGGAGFGSAVDGGRKLIRVALAR